MSRSVVLRASFVIVLATAGSHLAVAQRQTADPNFDARVTNPAYIDKHPVVLFDEAHNNFQTAAGGYKPFVDLIKNDGYRVVVNKQKFDNGALDGYTILAIADALGAAPPPTPPADRLAFITEASKPAFTEKECDILRDWVRAGGALLLASDHLPVGAAMEILGKRFGVAMSKVILLTPTKVRTRKTVGLSFRVGMSC